MRTKIDDLVKRLRTIDIEWDRRLTEWCAEAADRIELLEEELENLRKERRKDSLQYLSDVGQMQDRIEEMEAKTASRIDDTQTISIIDMIEHEDGSCTVTLDITQRTAQLLLEIGFLKLLEDHIKETEDERREED